MINSKTVDPYIGEPDKERLFSAFKRKSVDRVPNLEILIEDKHVEAFLGKYAGNTLAIGGDPAKGEVSDDIRPMYPDNFINLCNIIGQDAMIFDGGLLTPFSRKDEDGSLVPVLDKSVKTKDDFKKLVLESDKQINKAVKYVKEYKDTVKKRNSRIGISCAYGCIFQTLYEFLFKMNDFMVMVYEERDFVEEMLEISTEHYEKFTKAVVKAGIDFIFPADDVAFRTGLFIPPKIFKEIWVPRMARIFEPAINAGIPVLFHSDGKIDEIVNDLLDMGLDCLNPMDPSGIDYSDYKERFGNRLCLSGNINVELLSKNKPEDIAADVKKHMDIMKPGSGYVIGSSHSIVNYIPHENVIAYFNAIHEYGKY